MYLSKQIRFIISIIEISYFKQLVVITNSFFPTNLIYFIVEIAYLKYKFFKIILALKNLFLYYSNYIMTFAK